MWRWIRAGQRSAGWCRVSGFVACSTPFAAPEQRKRWLDCETIVEAPQPETPPAEGLGLNSEHLSIFSRSGTRVSFAEVLAALEQTEVALIGEVHDDPVAHQVELYLLMSLLQRRPYGLSLEMFEADVQTVLNEYMAGKIREKDFLMDARPWANYQSDYRLLVEYAKRAQMPIVAANVPRRYVSAVGRAGICVLTKAWPANSMSWMPPLPLPAPSDGYLKHLSQSPAVPVHAEELGMMGGGCPYMRRPQELKSSIILWDSAMAHSIAKQLEAHPGHGVFHVCGVFHAERSTGIGEMLSHYRPGTGRVVVAIYPEQDCHTFVLEKHADTADFVVLTDASLPRSYDHFS